MSDNLKDLKNNHQDFSKGSLDSNEEKNPYVLLVVGSMKQSPLVNWK